MRTNSGDCCWIGFWLEKCFKIVYIIVIYKRCLNWLWFFHFYDIAFGEIMYTPACHARCAKPAINNTSAHVLYNGFLLILLLVVLTACTASTQKNNPAQINPGIGGGATNLTANQRSPQYFNTAIGDRVFFAVDQSTLSLDAQNTLAEQARWLLANPEYTLIIEGHTDERGTRAYNLALGAQRASSMRDFLVLRGIPDRRIQTVTYGKERPYLLCSREECYRQNRRGVSVITALGQNNERADDFAQAPTQ